jgi:hypothetical protein
MQFLLVVRVKLCRPFEYWKKHFDAHRDGRRTAGIEDVFCYAIVGEQAALYGVLTRTPRAVHDMVYDEATRPMIEASGFVVGSEDITVCEYTE